MKLGPEKADRRPVAQVPLPATHPIRQKRAFAIAFKLGVLSYATYGRVDDGKGGLRPPLAREVRTLQPETYSISLEMEAGGGDLAFDETFNRRDTDHLAGVDLNSRRP